MSVFEPSPVSSLGPRVATLEGVVAVLQAAVVANASAADTAVEQEATVRAAGDTARSTAITAEQVARIAGDLSLADSIADEILARAAGDAINRDALDLAIAQARAIAATGVGTVAESWSVLVTVMPDARGPAGAIVLDIDVGQHVDPVTAASVDNAGIYRFVREDDGDPVGWKRIGNTALADITAVLDAVSDDRDHVDAVATAFDAEVDAALADVATARAGAITDVNAVGAIQIAAVNTAGATQAAAAAAVLADMQAAVATVYEPLSFGVGASVGASEITTLHNTLYPIPFADGDLIDSVLLDITTIGAAAINSAFVTVDQAGLVTAITAGPSAVFNSTTGVKTFALGGVVAVGTRYVVLTRSGTTAARWAQNTEIDGSQRFLGALAVGSDFASTTTIPLWGLVGRRPVKPKAVKDRVAATELALGTTASDTTSYVQGPPDWQRAAAAGTNAGVFLAGGGRVAVSGKLSFAAKIATAGRHEVFVAEMPGFAVAGTVQTGGLVPGAYRIVRRETFVSTATGEQLFVPGVGGFPDIDVTKGQVILTRDETGQISTFTKAGLYVVGEVLVGNTIALGASTVQPAVELRIIAPKAIAAREIDNRARALRGKRSIGRTNFTTAAGLGLGSWTATAAGLSCPAASSNAAYFTQLYHAQIRSHLYSFYMTGARTFAFVWSETNGAAVDYQNGATVEIDVSGGLGSAVLRVKGYNGIANTSTLLASAVFSDPVAAGRVLLARIIKDRFDYRIRILDPVLRKVLATIRINSYSLAGSTGFHMLGATGIMTTSAGSAGDVVITSHECVNGADRNFDAYVAGDSITYGANGATELRQSTHWDYVDAVRNRGDWLIAGYPGKTATDGVAQMAGDFDGTLCQRVLLAHCTNQTSLATFRDVDVPAAAAKCTALGAELILVTSSGKTGSFATTDSINAWIRSSGYRYVDNAAIWCSDPTSTATYIAAYFADAGTHPSQEGHKAAALAYPYMHPWLYDGSGYDFDEIVARTWAAVSAA